MIGLLISVWGETWREIWLPLSEQESAPQDLFCELFREAMSSFKTEAKERKLVEAANNTEYAKLIFSSLKPAAFKDEANLISFLESAFTVMQDMAGDNLSNPYFDLVERFLKKYGLRYDLRRPFSLHPTLEGMFSTLLAHMRALTNDDAHIAGLLRGYEESIRDLKLGISPDRIKTCIGKQFMFAEAIAQNHNEEIKAQTLGAMCGQLQSWPHKTIQDALGKLYGFASDYPGIRHGGSPEGVKREIEMKDMIALSVILAGFTPYLSSHLDADFIYHGGK